MNWYKITKLAGLPTVNLRTFLTKIQLMGAEFKREGKGDHAIYWHPQTRKQTPVPMGPYGRTINPLTLVHMLKNLGFNLKEFRGIGENQGSNDIRSWLSSFDLTNYQILTIIESLGWNCLPVIKKDPFILIEQLKDPGKLTCCVWTSSHTSTQTIVCAR